MHGLLSSLSKLFHPNEGAKPPTPGERIIATYNAASRIFAEAAQFDFDSAPGVLDVNVIAEDGRTYAVQYYPQTENGQGEIEILTDDRVIRAYQEKPNASNCTTMAVTGILDGRAVYGDEEDYTMEVSVPKNPGKKEVVSFSHLFRGLKITYETRKINRRDMEVVDPALQAIDAVAETLQKQRPGVELTNTLPQQIEKLRN